MADIQNSKLLWTKAGLFVVVAILAMLLTFLGRYRNFVPFLFFWSVSVWASCRAYYFAFYAIEKYVDPNFKYAGIGSMVEYVLGRQRQPAMQTMGGGEGEPSRWLSPFARLSLRWLVVAAIANMVVPTLLPSRYGVYFNEYVNFLLLACTVPNSPPSAISVPWCDARQSTASLSRLCCRCNRSVPCHRFVERGCRRR